MIESDLQRAVVEFLEKHGWAWHRTQFAAIAGMFATGERGMADGFAVRYMPNELQPARCLLVWLEFKRKGDKRGCECMKRALRAAQNGKRKPGLCHFCQQKKWQATERSKGADVWTAITDYDLFIQRYHKSFGWLHRDSQPVTPAGQQSLPLAGGE